MTSIQFLSWTGLQYLWTKILAKFTAVNARIDNISSVGRYLSNWNCAVGYPTSEPTTSPYTYIKGDYFLVSFVCNPNFNAIKCEDFNDVWFYPTNTIVTHNGIQYRKYYDTDDDIAVYAPKDTILVVGDSVLYDDWVQTLEVSTIEACHNYRPNGSQFVIGTYSTTEYTGTLNINDMFIYDGSEWMLLQTSGKTVAFGAIEGSPYDNSALSTTLNSKINKIANAIGGFIAQTNSNGEIVETNKTINDFDAIGAASSAVSNHNSASNAHSNIIAPMQNSISTIEGKIPSQASSSNQLADKAFVKSSIGDVAFRGVFDCTNQLPDLTIDLARDLSIATSQSEKTQLLGKMGTYFSYDGVTGQFFYRFVGGMLELYQGNILIASVGVHGSRQIQLSDGVTLHVDRDSSPNGVIYVDGDNAFIINSLLSDDDSFLDMISWDGKSGYVANDGDFAHVQYVEEDESFSVRYKYSNNTWVLEYNAIIVNNTPKQQATLNSGIEADMIPSNTSGTNKLTNASDVAAAIAAGAEVFTAIYGSTTYADILAAYNAGKIVIGKSGSLNGLICYIDNASTLKAIYFSSQTDYFYMWKVNKNNEWGSITREWENVSRKVTTLSAGSTDAQYPSAKCVYDATKNKADKTTSAVKTYASGTTYTLVANEIATLDASMAASGDSISIALPASPAVTDCFDIQITLGANVPSINLPSVSWLGGSEPTFSASKKYEINIMNGLAVCGEF